MLWTADPSHKINCMWPPYRTTEQSFNWGWWSWTMALLQLFTSLKRIQISSSGWNCLPLTPVSPPTHCLKQLSFLEIVFKTTRHDQEHIFFQGTWNECLTSLIRVSKNSHQGGLGHSKFNSAHIKFMKTLTANNLGFLFCFCILHAHKHTQADSHKKVRHDQKQSVQGKKIAV